MEEQTSPNFEDSLHVRLFLVRSRQLWVSERFCRKRMLLMRAVGNELNLSASQSYNYLSAYKSSLVNGHCDTRCSYLSLSLTLNMLQAYQKQA
jgi:hypothetical protein